MWNESNHLTPFRVQPSKITAQLVAEWDRIDMSARTQWEQIALLRQTHALGRDSSTSHRMTSTAGYSHIRQQEWPLLAAAMAEVDKICSRRGQATTARVHPQEYRNYSRMNRSQTSYASTNILQAQYQRAFPRSHIETGLSDIQHHHANAYTSQALSDKSARSSSTLEPDSLVQMSPEKLAQVSSDQLMQAALPPLPLAASRQLTPSTHQDTNFQQEFQQERSQQLERQEERKPAARVIIQTGTARPVAKGQPFLPQGTCRQIGETRLTP